MALGTVTKVSGADAVFGNKKVKVRTLQLTSGANYTTGGETLNASAVGMRSLDQVIVQANPRNATTGAISSLGVNYVSPQQVKLQAYFSAAGAADVEVASNTDLSSYTVRLTLIGA